MSINILVGTPLETDPYLELLHRTEIGDPGTPIGIFSPLAATPKRLKASKTLAKMALVTDLRSEDVVGLGTLPGADTVPTGGIRVINENDRFIFFGANNVRDPIMFERSSLFYRDTQSAEDLVPSPGNYAHAAFSKGGRWFLAAEEDDPGTVNVWEWTGEAVTDPEGVWAKQSPDLTTASGTITGIRVSPLNTVIMIQNSVPQFRFFDTDTGDWAGSGGWIAGYFLDWKPDESEIIYAPQVNASDVIAGTIDYATGVITQTDTLPNSGGSQRKGRYSPDGEVITITGRPTSGTEVPRFYSKVAGSYTFAGGVANANAASVNVIDYAFAPDGRMAIASSDSAAARVDLFFRDATTPEPFTPDGNLTAAGIAAFSTANRSADGMVIMTPTQVWRYVADVLTNVTPAGWATTARLYQSANADGSIIMGVSASAVVVYTWDGSAYVAAAVPGTLPTGLRACSLSPSGVRSCLLGISSTTVTLRFYTRNTVTGAFTVTETLTWTLPSATTQTRLDFVPGREDLVTANVQGMTSPRVYKHDGSVWAFLDVIPVNATYPYTMAAGWHPGGDYFAVGVRDASLNWRVAIFFRAADDTFTQAYLSPANVSTNGVLQTLAYAPDGEYLIGQGNTGAGYFLWDVDGPNLTAHALPSGGSLSTTAAIWGVDHLILFTSTTSPKWIYDMSGAVQTYALETTFALTGTAVPSYVTFSPAGDVLHYGRNGDSHHVLSASPYAPLGSLSFAEYTPSDVHDVLYSQTGKVVLFTGPNGPEVAVRQNLGSSFVNSRTIDGCFVFVYDRDGDWYVERGWTQHPATSAIRDLNFSPNEDVFSYHVIVPSDAGGDATRGRLIFDVSIVEDEYRYEFRGQIWEPEMSNSFIAFSPWNTHFVVTHEHLATNDPIITLHEFGVNYTYVTQDTKPVEFGPPDFSKCDDVVVAHGGAIPLTFFKHDDVADVLIPRPVDIIDWTAETVVLDVAFSDDCEGLVILTPDEIIPLEPEGEDELKPEEPTVLEEPVEEEDEPSIIVDPDWDIVVDPGPIKPGYPGWYHWDPEDPTPVYSIAYVPYSVVTVTFRVKSIPS